MSAFGYIAADKSETGREEMVDISTPEKFVEWLRHLKIQMLARNDEPGRVRAEMCDAWIEHLGFGADVAVLGKVVGR